MPGRKQFICSRSGILFRINSCPFIFQQALILVFPAVLSSSAQALSVFSGDISVIFPSVGNQAARAVLDPVFCITEIPAAFLSQRVQRTVAEQAVEVLRIRALMTGKIFTFFMAEKRVLFAFPKRFLHVFPPSNKNPANYQPHMFPVK